MPSYAYIALDSSGKEKAGTIQADTETLAVSRIREKGFFPTQVTEVGAGSGKISSKPRKKSKGTSAAGGGALQMELKMPAFMSRVKTKQLMVFTRQMSTLVNAGLPLLRCMQVLKRQEKNPALLKALDGISESIQSGSTFADALTSYPKIFNRLYVNMVKAGEIGGVLDVVLNRLAEFMEKAQRIKNKVVGAMVYPVVVLFMAFLIVSFLMVFVIPKFEEIFKDLLEGQELPALTQFVMNASRSFGSNGPIAIGLIIVVVTVLKVLRKFDKPRYVMDLIKLKLPIFGPLVSRTAIARFTRTLGTLLTSGVPVLQALNIVRDTAGNEVLANAVVHVHDAVKEGENIAPPLEACGVFPPIVVSMVEVGEETGDLPEMLMKVADNYDDEVDNAVAGLTSVIEPLLIVFLAVIVGVIVIALFMPLISVIGNLSG